jgi:hypothetical protein
MRKLGIGLAAIAAVVFAGLLTWKAEATTLIAPTKNYSPLVQEVGCRAPGRCGLGRVWVCAPRGCWCAPCGGYWGAPYVYPLRPWRWRY